MSQLNDAIGRAIELHDHPGQGIEVHSCVKTAWGLLKDDDESVEILCKEAIAKRIKDKVTNASRNAATASSTQLPLFPNLRAAYALDIDGRRLKDTRDLSRMEFKRLIVIRRDQLTADAAHLKHLTDAEREVAALWDASPGKTFGEICDIYAAQRRAAE